MTRAWTELRCLLSEKGAYSPDVVQHESTGKGCCSNVDSKGKLTVQCHTQVPCSLDGATMELSIVRIIGYKLS